jgi:hypothetical protein
MFVTLKTVSGKPIRTVFLTRPEKKQKLVNRLLAYGFDVSQSGNVIYLDYKPVSLFS